MYKELITHLRKESHYYSDLSRWAKSENRDKKVVDGYLYYAVQYLSAIDILRILDGQDLSMNRRNATLTHTDSAL